MTHLPLQKVGNLHPKISGFNNILRYLFTILAFLFLSSTSNAQLPVTWTGAVNSNWNNPSNWILGLVPNTAGFTALINGGSHAPHISSDITIHNIVIGTSGHLTIDEGAELKLQTAFPVNSLGILLNTGTVTNYGDIIISSTSGLAQNAIYNTGTFTHETTFPGNTPLIANIIIENSYGNGITNSGTFTNKGGTIRIGTEGSINGYGIQTEDGIFGNVKAGFSISSTPLLEIDNTTDDGIQVANGSAFNIASGSIVIGANVVVAHYGIDNLGTVHASGGIINTARTGWSGIRNRNGASLFILGSTITIGTVNAAGGHGVRNEGSILNRKTINVKAAINAGVYNSATGVITNDLNIFIGTTSAVGESGIENEGLINNNKTININRATLYGVNNESGAQFNNNNGSNLSIGTSQAVGNTGIFNDFSTFINNGTLTIARCQGHGIYNGAQSQFTNNSGKTVNIGTVSVGQRGIFMNHTNTSSFTNNGGTININNTGASSSTINEAVYLRNGAKLNNQNGGQILIGQTGSIGGIGIHLSNADCELINNNGSIKIDDTGSEGILIASSSKVENKSGGQLFIGENGLIGSASHATIKAGASSGSVLNLGCSKMYLYDFINMGSTPFTNAGLVLLDTGQAHSNNGTFTNNGVINYIQSPLIPNIINNDLIIAASSSTGCSFTNVMQKGPANNFTPQTTWFTNEAMTISGGTYNNGNNTFTANSVQEGNNSLYFQLSGNGCTFSVKIGLTGIAINPGKRTWTGVAGTNWGDACNWSPGGVPSTSDDVLLANVTNKPIISGNTLAKSVVVDANVDLNILTGGSLTIDGSTSTGLLNNGAINNNGTLTIDNTSSHALQIGNTGTFTNTAAIYIGQNGGSFNIQGAGIRVENEFNNNAGGSIYISDAMARGIHVTNSGIFNNNAAVIIGQNSNLNNVGTAGIYVQNEFNNNAGGSVTLENIGAEGIWITNTGKFINSSILSLGQNAGGANIDGAGIYNLGLFINNASGTINIDDTNSDGIYSRGGSPNGFFNYGNLNIGQNTSWFISSDGLFISSSGNFQNLGGTINIDKTGAVGLHCQGTLTNTGQINIGQLRNIGLRGIENIGTIHHNNGIINIDRSKGAILNSQGTFNNQATINIGANNSVGEYGINNQTTFNNTNNGIINIGQGGGSGNIARDGITNTGTFNLNSGTIRIAKTNQAGLVTDQGSFNNSATLIIGNTTGDAIIADPSAPSATFNNTGGRLQVDGTISTVSHLAGTLAPGNSPGHCNSLTSLNILAATLDIEVYGPTPMYDHDLLTITNTAFLGGALNVDINYTPPVDVRIVFLTANSILGTFTTVSPSLPAGWTIDYSVAGEVALQFSQLLPVELVDFTATRNGSEVLLEWETATEIDNEGFEIWHSMDGIDWKDIGFVNGKGTTQQTQQYDFIHEQPEQGSNYYRLKQIDFDSEFSYSEIRIIDFDSKEEAIQVNVYPNPATDFANISFPIAHEEGFIRVTSANGQVMHQTTITEDQQKLQLELGQWPAGMYLMHIQLGKQSFTKKLIHSQF